ncbi:MAG TPA: gluconokinase, GntK/IdnK-type [Gemmatimonadales bacterium]|nr:gluconokinase, GntK/IdnK-type [Gemmatimonadales bacterium]
MSTSGAVVVMGVAGAGKTAVGRALGAAVGWRFVEADDFHSAENVARMHAGVPLTDEDRAPWLEALRIELTHALHAGEHIVLACSALRHSYRVALVPQSAAIGWLQFVYLRASESLLHERLERRTGHYAGVTLLASQLQTLEEPADALWVDASRPVAEIVGFICQRLELPCA